MGKLELQQFPLVKMIESVPSRQNYYLFQLELPHQLYSIFISLGIMFPRSLTVHPEKPTKRMVGINCYPCQISFPSLSPRASLPPHQKPPGKLCLLWRERIKLRASQSPKNARKYIAADSNAILKGLLMQTLPVLCDSPFYLTFYFISVSANLFSSLFLTPPTPRK